jgi:Uma2 family endonuclease
VNRSTESFVVQLVGTPFMASIQNPIRLPNNSEPQPDLAVVRRSVRGVADAVDVLLVVEVADSSRAYDRGKKLPLYAAAGIPEVWLVDLVAQTIERYTDPREGRYRQLLTVSRGERLAATALPNLTIAVDDLLG